ncbi:MAG: hypothetical protein H6R05_275 [Burkholderiaceae bacterium]|nr:hypothetical protein [Burkholderiaceae bacterium]
MTSRLYQYLEQLRHKQIRWGRLWLVVLVCVISIQATQGYTLSNSSAHFVQVCTEKGLQDIAVQTDDNGDWVMLHHDDICQACATVVLGAPPVVATLERTAPVKFITAVTQQTVQLPTASDWSPARPQPPPVVSPQSDLFA